MIQWHITIQDRQKMNDILNISEGYYLGVYIRDGGHKNTETRVNVDLGTTDRNNAFLKSDEYEICQKTGLAI